MGYILGTLFIRAYEQGERVYISMVCRGYGRHSFLYVRKKTLAHSDLAFLLLSMIFVITIPVFVWVTRFALL